MKKQFITIDMLRNLFLMLAMLLILSVSAKEPKVMVSIKVLDAYSELPVEGAKVSVADSTGVILADSLSVMTTLVSRQAYTDLIYTGKVPMRNNYLITVKAGKYEPKTLNFSPDTDSNIYQTFYMRYPQREKVLNELTVTATRVKMIMKGDTIEYDATAFQLPEGSMLDALIRALPGATLDDNGRISVNGQFVESLLLNGQDFFKGDPQVALQNLPAYTVKNIQVYRRTPLESMMKGDISRDPSKDPLVLDVNLKKEYLGGWLANAEFGAGSGLRGGWNTRWLGRLFGMYFTKISYFAVHASANNLNDSEKPTSRGEWYRPSVSSGETTTKRVGVEYNTKWSDKSFDGVNTKFNLVRKSSLMSSVSNSEAFMEGGNTFSRSAQTTDRSSWLAEWYGELTRKTDKLGFFYMMSEIKNEKGLTGSKTESDESNTMLPEGYVKPGSADYLRNQLYTRQQLWNIRDNKFDAWVRMSYNPAWLRTERFHYDLSGRFDYQRYKKDESGSDRLLYTDDPTGSFLQLQRGVQPSHFYSYVINPEFQYLLLSSEKGKINFKFDYEYRQTYNSGRRTLEEINADSSANVVSVAESGQWILNEANSYYTRRFGREHAFTPNLSFIFSDLWFSLSGTFAHNNRSLDDFRNETIRHIGRKDWKHSAYFYLSFKDFGANFHYNQELPEMLYLLDVSDTSNPLVVNLGNSSLKKSNKYSANVSWEKNRFNSLNTSVRIEADYSRKDNSVAMARSYDRRTGVTTWQPMNINGNWDAGFEFYFFTRLTPDEDNYLVTNKLKPTFERNVDFSSDDEALRRLSVNNWALREEFKFDYSYNSKNRFSAKVDLKWNRMVSLNGVFSPFSYLDVNYGITADTQLPRNFAVGTDLMVYTRSGYADRTMNRSDFVWNLQVSKSFGKSKEWTVKAVGFDILRQLPSVVRTVNAQGRTEIRYNSQPAYALLTLSYRLSIQPRKK